MKLSKHKLNPLIEIAIDSYHKLFAKEIFYVIALDFLFITLYIFVRNMFGLKILDFLTVIGMEISQNSSDIISLIGESGMISALFGISAIKSAALSVFYLYTLMFICLFILYIIVQGLSWHYIYVLNKEKIGIVHFMKRFSVKSIPWFLSFVLIGGISLVFEILSVLKKYMHEDPGSGLFIPIVTFVVIYLGLVSYSEINKKSQFWKKALDWKIAGIFLVMLGVAFFVNWLITLIPSQMVRMVLELLIFITILVYMRLFFINISRELIRQP